MSINVVAPPRPECCARVIALRCSGAGARQWVRLSLLVSDGTYVGEGSYQVLMTDPVGGPLLTARGELLVRLRDTVVKTQ